MMEMFYFHVQYVESVQSVAAINHIWLLTSWNVANMTKELNI